MGSTVVVAESPVVVLPVGVLALVTSVPLESAGVSLVVDEVATVVDADDVLSDDGDGSLPQPATPVVTIATAVQRHQGRTEAIMQRV